MTTFLQELSSVLAARAARVDENDRGFSSIALAAHLFATATYLRQRYGDAAMDTRPPSIAIDLEEALELAATISPTDPVDAYQQACAALVGIDSFYDRNRLVIATLIPAHTVLQTISDGARPAIFGIVNHWIRPKNAWRDARVCREEEVPHVNVYPPTPADHLDALGMVWDRGELPEVVPVRRGDLPSRPGGFRIALCPAFCGAHPRFSVNTHGDRFTIDQARPFSDADALRRHLAALAPHLEASNIQLLVLPELSITVDARAQLVEMLAASQSMVGIVAGSFHVWRDGDDTPHNEAVFYVPRTIAWAHDKLGYFRVTDRQIRAFGAFFTQPLPVLQARVIEGIRRGSTLHFWDTRMGRIAIVICADAIARESMIPAIERVSPDVLLIPSLSLETDEFDRLGESLARRGISTFYVNAGCVCEITPKPHAALVHVALPTPRAAPHSRIAWKLGDPPQSRSFKGQPWSDAPADQVQVLGNDEGIVVDLELHLAWRPDRDL